MQPVMQIAAVFMARNLTAKDREIKCLVRPGTHWVAGSSSASKHWVNTPPANSVSSL